MVFSQPVQFLTHSKDKVEDKSEHPVKKGIYELVASSKRAALVVPKIKDDGSIYIFVGTTNKL